MDGWRLDPTRLRALREKAELTATATAELVGMHLKSYRKFESINRSRPGLVPAAAAEPSAARAHAIARVLGERLGRQVRFDEFATPVESSRHGATYRESLDLLGPDVVAAIRARLGPPKPLSPEQIATLVPIFLRGEPQRADPAA